MGATRIEFRLRALILAAFIVLGFWSPWIPIRVADFGFGQRIPLVMWLALEFSRTGFVSFAVAMRMAIALGALIAAKGMVFRLWGAAYLGPATVCHHQMQAVAVVAGGPYRHVRNPLYIGTWAMIAAIAFLMPPTGALLLLIAVPAFLLRLTLGEEAFLTSRLGQPYLDYIGEVPRLIPRLHAALPPDGRKPRWLHAVFSELNPIGVFVTMAFLAWSFDIRLMVRAMIVGFGLSLVARALLPADKTET